MFELTELSVLTAVMLQLDISARDIMATLSETVDAYSDKSVKSTKQPCMSVATTL